MKKTAINICTYSLIIENMGEGIDFALLRFCQRVIQEKVRLYQESSMEQILVVLKIS